MVAAAKYLGIGMYSPREAAMYARVSTRLISRWVHGTTKAAAALHAEVEDRDEKTVTFLDLVQTMAIRAIREQSETRVPLQAIREAVDYAASAGVTYPFARKHTTYLYGQTIILNVEGNMLEASGARRGKQYAMKKIVEIYAKDIGYNSAGLADAFTAYEYRDREIVMKPAISFGEPVLARTGHTAWTLWEAVHSEGSIEKAAEAYEVETADVEAAYRYIDSILPATAA